MAGRPLPTSTAPILVIAGWSLLIAAIAAAVGIVFLALMYASFAAGALPGGEGYGRVNDILVVVQYALLVPVIAAIYVFGHERWPGRSLAIAVSGAVLVALIVLLQGLLIADLMTFEQQIGPVSVVFVLLGAWFVAVGELVNALGIGRRGVLMGLIAATYVGYPIWAFWLGRALRERAATSPTALASDLPA